MTRAYWRQGSRIRMTNGDVVVADGTVAYRIFSGHSTDNLDGRLWILPPGEGAWVLAFRPGTDAAEHVRALISREVDIVTRVLISAEYLARESGGTLAVGAKDSSSDRVSAFALDVDDAELLECLNDKIDYLTDDLSVEIPDWLDDPTVFMQRALAWKPD